MSFLLIIRGSVSPLGCSRVSIWQNLFIEGWWVHWNRIISKNISSALVAWLLKITDIHLILPTCISFDSLSPRFVFIKPIWIREEVPLWSLLLSWRRTSRYHGKSLNFSISFSQMLITLQGIIITGGNFNFRIGLSDTAAIIRWNDAEWWKVIIQSYHCLI